MAGNAGRADPQVAHQETADRHVAHQRVIRLADEVLPALIARLGVSDLGEIEIRRGDWRIRLRKARRATTSTVGDGQRAEAHRRPVRERRRTPPASPSAGGPPPSQPVADGGLAPAAAVTGNGAGSAPVAVGPGVERPRGDVDDTTAPGTDPRRVVARSPAVGYFVPRAELAVGHTTRSGDLLGHIDVLGVRQDVVSPADGVVGRLFVEPGEAVEYGQELLRVDPTMSRRAADRPA